MHKYQEIIDAMNKLADWIEKEENVHCRSKVRRAADLLVQLSEENEILKIKLGYDRKTLRDWVWYIQNSILYVMYVIKKRFYFSRKKR